jgi:ElaB/YqjD/DUF883 family membrane-anchored ribosome-binding protein
MENLARDGTAGSADRVKEAFIEVKETIKDAGKQASVSAMKAVNELSGLGRHTLDNISEEGKKEVTMIEDYVRKYPIRSVIYGAAVGAILSKFIKV